MSSDRTGEVWSMRGFRHVVLVVGPEDTKEHAGLQPDPHRAIYPVMLLDAERGPAASGTPVHQAAYLPRPPAEEDESWERVS